MRMTFFVTQLVKRDRYLWINVDLAKKQMVHIGNLSELLSRFSCLSYTYGLSWCLCLRLACLCKEK